MCTCGIDIATQQATPATHSSVCAAPSDRPNGRLVATPARGAGRAGRRQLRERRPPRA